MSSFGVQFIDGTYLCMRCQGTGKVRHLMVIRKKCPTCEGKGRIHPPQATTHSATIRQLHFEQFDVNQRIEHKVQSAQRQRRYRTRPFLNSHLVTQSARPVQSDTNMMPVQSPLQTVISRHPDEPKVYVRQRRFHMYKQVAPPFHPQHPLKQRLRNHMPLLTEVEGVERTWYLVKE